MSDYNIQQSIDMHDALGILNEKIVIQAKNSLVTAINYLKMGWIDVVNTRVRQKGWADTYKQSIQVQTIDNGMTGQVWADDQEKYVNFIENGIARFDMKNDLLKGRDSRVIPMRKGTPGSIHLPAMPDIIYSRIKQAASYLTIGINDDKTRLRTKAVTIKLKEKIEGMTLAEKFKMVSKKWKSGQYEGLTKTNYKGQTAYVTFRIVTKNSMGWRYPGSTPYHIYDQVGETILPRAVQMFQNGLKPKGGT
jgi:hypothetical protein